MTGDAKRGIDVVLLFFLLIFFTGFHIFSALLLFAVSYLLRWLTFKILRYNINIITIYVLLLFYLSIDYIFYNDFNFELIINSLPYILVGLIIYLMNLNLENEKITNKFIIALALRVKSYKKDLKAYFEWKGQRDRAKAKGKIIYLVFFVICILIYGIYEIIFLR